MSRGSPHQATKTQHPKTKSKKFLSGVWRCFFWGDTLSTVNEGVYHPNMLYLIREWSELSLEKSVMPAVVLPGDIIASGAKQSWVEILPLPLSSCMVLGKISNCFDP